MHNATSIIMIVLGSMTLSALPLWIVMANANYRLSRENYSLHGKLAEHRIIADRHKGEIERLSKLWEKILADLEAELISARKRLDQPTVNGRFVKREKA